MNTPDIAAIQRATRALYDRQAAEYARSTDDYGLFPGLLAELDRFINRADRSRPLLDLGCGTGRDVAYLRKQGCTAVAADLSIQMLRTAGQWCAENQLPPVQLSMLHLPFRSGIFGGVWVCASLLHVPRAGHDDVLGEIFRVLAPGATAAISMKAGRGEGWQHSASLPDRRWFTLVDPADFAARLRLAGFTRISCTFSGRKNWFVAEADRP